MADDRAPSPGDDAATVDMNDANAEEERPLADAKPKYRSWKKKWRKLKMTFDQKMTEGEMLWDQEQKAKSIIKRIAIENDRLLDLLQGINNCPQVPPEKRIDVPSLDEEIPLSDEDEKPLSEPPAEPPSKSFVNLESEVPHLTFAQFKDAHPSLLEDIEPAAGEDEPATFLTIDEIEDYIYEIDLRLGLPKLPTLAPAAKRDENGTPAQPASNPKEFMIKHPHSAYNWLKRNAPHVFLQGDGEDEETTGKKGRGGKGEKAKPTARANKRASIAKERAADGDNSMEEDTEYITPARKRKRGDDDGGYRPKGGSSRPTKKKRKSEPEGTPAPVKKRRAPAAEKASRDD